MQVVIQADPLKKRKQLCILFVFPYLLSLITLFKCRLAPFKALQNNDFFWAYVPILSFFDQQEKFAASATCVTKLTLAGRQPSFVKFFVLRCLKYFSVNWLRGCSKIKAFMNAKPLPWQDSAPLEHIFWPYPSRMVPYLLS